MDPAGISSTVPVPAAIDALQVRFPDEQLATRMGIEFVSWDPDRLVATMPVTGNRQPFGLMHGGASAVLAETLGSAAAALRGLPDRMGVGLELSCSHHRAVVDGVVTGTCTPLSVGSTVVSFDITITDGLDRRICTARLTALLRARP
jgi:1,4-dihydroxy-2-naphthoyl-CoA hydrolase